jgi:hypothetical protein
MGRKNFETNYAGVLSAIERCLEGRLHLAALMLMYSTIDTLAWVPADKRVNNQRARFEDWVRKWLLPSSKLNCSPTDLYAARCAILHTLTYEADLTKSRKAKRILYAWGQAKVDAQRESFVRMGQDDTNEAVHLDELFSALRAGFAAFLAEAERDSTIKRSLEEASRLHFDALDIATVDEFLRVTKDR